MKASGQDTFHLEVRLWFLKMVSVKMASEGGDKEISHRSVN